MDTFWYVLIKVNKMHFGIVVSVKYICSAALKFGLNEAA